MDIYDIKLKNRQAGYHFFDADAMRFFNSRIGKTVYTGPSGIYFITSERFDQDTPRKYTVRRFHPNTGNIHTVGDFNELSRYQAHKLAAKLSTIQW